MTHLRLALALLASALALPARADEPPPAPPTTPAAPTPTAAAVEPEKTVRIHAGTQLGFPHFFGLTSIASFQWRGRPRFDVDFLWEPSGYLQSYSIGAAYHPADRLAFIGLRFRLLEFEPPWSRAYRSLIDDHFGLGLEVGVRKGLGWQKRVLLHATLQATYVPTQAPQLQWLLGLNVGVSYSVKSFALK